MDRENLIRRHFETYSDLLWVTNLEPKFRQYNLDAAEMKEYRDAWNRHTEAQDWDWWQEKVKGMPDAELQRDIAECHAEIDAFRKGLKNDRDRFQGIINGRDEKQPEREVTKVQGRGM